MMTTPPLGFSRNDEYESQFMEFCCEDLTISLKDKIESVIIDTNETLKDALMARQKTENEKIAVDSAVNKIKDVLLGCKAPFEKLQEQMPTFFGLPPHVLLPEDEVQRQRYSIEEEEQEKQKFQNMKARYKRAQYMKAFYDQEVSVATKLNQQLSRDLEIVTEARSSGLQVLNKQMNQTRHKHIQDLLGLEVKEAGIRLTGQPLCAENNLVLEDSILDCT